MSANSPNRLIHETSPYLLQHAHNPVEWYPWGREAFEAASRLDRPIFLSIGYSTCHWCHVMERESFEDQETAQLLNERYVAIKVDREERPDVDRLYMAAVQAMTGSGGWPLSAWLLPDRRPYYTGTYFPPEPRWGRPSFRQALVQLSDAYRTDRPRVERAATEATRTVITITSSLPRDAETESPLDVRLASAIDQASRQLMATYDADHGGFGGAPKFPRPCEHALLLYQARSDPEDRAAGAVLHTLERMWSGGIHDHLEGGFSRYSVDAVWRVPHFEKMLYDQAQLALSFLDAWQLTGDDSNRRVVHQILDYVGRRLTNDEGGFLSAEDADSAPDADRPEEREEGAFYLWTLEELTAELPAEELAVAVRCWGITEPGNAIADPHGELLGRNVLYVARSTADVATELGLTSSDAERLLEEARARLLQLRDRRPRPHRDDKVITAWNGLMISACARAAARLGRAEDLERARRAAHFVLDRCVIGDETPRLVRSYREGETRGAGQLQDYSALALGLLDLYYATFEDHWLSEAVAWTERMISAFADPDDGAFFDSDGADSDLLARTKESADGAEPSGNALAARLLLELGALLERDDLTRLGIGVLQRFAPLLEQAPRLLPYMLQSARLLLEPPSQVVVVGELDEPLTRDLIATARVTGFEPDRRVVALPRAAELLRSRPYLAALPAATDRPIAYLCRNFSCQAPTSEPSTLRDQLQHGSGRPPRTARTEP